MSQEDSEFWARARLARDKLVDQVLDHPDVSLIDIGYAPERDEETEEIVLRIHVRERWMKAEPEERVAFPEDVDGIPVIVMLGDYRLETDAPAASEESNQPDSNSRSTIMITEENTAASVDDGRDDLETINGIGPTFAEALYKTGVRRFTDLAQYTPVELSKALLEQIGLKVPVQRIEADDWIGQARALAPQVNTERELPEEEAKVVREPEKVNHPTWHQHAGFSLFFDYVTDEHGEQVWQTRVYHDESGEEMLFSGIEPAPWVNWVLEQSELPIAGELAPTETEAAPPSAPVTPHDAQIEILDVQVSEVQTPVGVREKKLLAKVSFQISGSEADALTTERIPFR
ncbi:MAG: hypothetical protein ACE5FA_13865, partial [Dehalococcoidia bacterium]